MSRDIAKGQATQAVSLGLKLKRAPRDYRQNNRHRFRPVVFDFSHPGSWIFLLLHTRDPLSLTLSSIKNILTKNGLCQHMYRVLHFQKPLKISLTYHQKHIASYDICSPEGSLHCICLQSKLVAKATAIHFLLLTKFSSIWELGTPL